VGGWTSVDVCSGWLSAVTCVKNVSSSSISVSGQPENQH
jgi:hypothetical protein